jgi:hypothetical protein
MTDPRHAYNRPGEGRWYRHPITGEEWPSVTNVLDVCVAKPALVPWAAKITAEKAWLELPRMVALSRAPSTKCADKRVADRCGECRFCLTAELKAEVKIAKDMAADLGSRIHAHLDARAKGAPSPDDPEVVPFVEQALRFFADFGIDLDKHVEAAEATVVNRTVGYAGTGDLWAKVKVGGRWKLLLIDYKSSSTRAVDSVFTENGMQLAALARGEVLLLDNGDEVEPPGPIHGTAVLNLRKGGYALIPMPPNRGDLDAAFDAFCGALKEAVYIHSQHGSKPEPMLPPTPKDDDRKVA